MTFYALGLLITGIASTAGAVNLARHGDQHARAGHVVVPDAGVRMDGAGRAVPAGVLAADHHGGAVRAAVRPPVGHRTSSIPTAGGDPILWQHLFWLFGHPEVYILILPAFGIFSEMLPVFSRKPLFGYQFVVFSGIAIGFIGFGVWAHHMFAAGLGPVANTAFGISTAIIAIPTGVKIFNWMATMYGGDIRFTSPMLFAVGAVAMFVIGGLSGVTHAVVPADYQQTDTYYIVAHFHYVIFGGADLRAVLGAVLLVAEGVRPDAVRGHGQGAVLAHDDRVQPGVRTDARPGAAGHDPPRVHVPGVARPHVLEPGRDGRGVPDRAVGPGVHRQRDQDAAAARPVETRIRGTRARWSG